VLAERRWGLKPGDLPSSVSRSMATPAFDFQEMLGSRTRPTASDWAEVLAGLPLFARVSKRRLRKIAALSQIQQFSPGAVVVQIGEPADAFYLILAGRASVVGKSRRTLGIGDYFGEMGLIDGEPRSATIAADDELETMKLARRPFLKLLKQEPQIAMSMMAELAARIRSLEKRPIL
jgi:CRP/FNR family transcriptional regulator, cyclic AMP receptor protein